MYFEPKLSFFVVFACIAEQSRVCHRYSMYPMPQKPCGLCDLFDRSGGGTRMVRRSGAVEAAKPW